MSEIYFKTVFQQKLEHYNLLFNKVAPEEQPYIHKYEGRKILEQELESEQLKNESDQYQISSKAIIYFTLGGNYHDTEETGLAEKKYKQSLELIFRLDHDHIIYFYNYLQELYNILGLIHLNKDDNETGISLLGKSQDLYKSISACNYPNAKIVNTMKDYLDRSRKLEENLEFRYFYQGGISVEKTESLYTHTMFYLAQAYTKLGQKQEAAQYCGLTMKRQLATGTYTLKDFCVNCISLSEFYVGLKQFKQAQYLLLAAVNLIPEGKKKKLRATMAMSLGNVIAEFLEVSVNIFINQEQSSESEHQEDEKELIPLFNKMSLNFEQIKLQIPDFKIAKTEEEIKSIFRQGNTQFKKSLEYFVLDGYVTEHCQIKEELQKMFKTLTRLERDQNRIYSMLEKRQELIEPILKEMNPKAYEATWQKLIIISAEIYHEMFEHKFNELFVNTKKMPKIEKIYKMNTLGEKSISLYNTIIQFLMADQNITKDKNYFQSIINAKFNIAKAHTKIYRDEKKDRVEELKKGLESYQWILSFIEKDVRYAGPYQEEFIQEYKLCQEMVSMLPQKISKVNYESSK